MATVLPLFIVGGVMAGSALGAEQGMAAVEMRAKADWLSRTALAGQGAPPFSFQYGDRHSPELLTAWRVESSSRVLDPERTERLLVWRDAASGLEVRCTAIDYQDLPAVECLLSFTNSGREDTPILSAIRALDLEVASAGKGFVLHRSLGESNSAQSFAPVDEAIAATDTQERVYAPNGGRSSDGHMPYFNVDRGAGGVVLAIGWSGQWEAGFGVTAGGGLHVRAGQQNTHFRLHPGETVRSPRIVLVFWTGDDDLRGNNLFRRLALRHYLPQRDGRPVFPPICGSVGRAAPDGTYEQPHLDAIAPWREGGVEVFWSDMDPQQWYPGGFPTGTGNWEVDTAKYPRGLKPIGDALRAAGMGYLLWFEPERVHPGTKTEREHPDWIMKAQGEWSQLFRLHDPQARAWLTDCIDQVIREAQLTWVRWDFNIEPLGFWLRNDAPDRVGITEIRHQEGLYAMWAELERRHPGLLIDNCASGGRRLDIEAGRYGLPLWHSDLQCSGSHPADDQLQNAGLLRWVPMHGCGNFGLEPSYAFRSAMTAGNILAVEPKAEALSRTVAIFRKLRPYMLGDFYPLFPHDASPNVWFGYQFHRPAAGDGYAILFRREASPEARQPVRLRAVLPETAYEVSFEDGPETATASGADLQAFPVAIAEKPGTAILYYRPVPPTGAVRP